MNLSAQDARDPVEVDVGAADEFIDGTPTLAIVGGRQIIVVRYGESFFAIRNVCPHQSASFAGGMVAGRVKSDRPGEFSIDERDPVLICPWHSWQYRLRDGDCIVDPQKRVRAYKTTRRHGRVFVEIDFVARRASLE